MPRCQICTDKFQYRYSSFEKTCDKEFCKKEFIRLSNLKPKPIKEKTPNLKLKGMTARKSINKVSKKQAVLNLQYSADRIVFLAKKENQICFIDGCNSKATTVEHRAGRKGFYDQWARDNNIPLILDQRFWAGCCWNHQGELENNSELSHQYQLSKIHGGKKGN